MKYRTPIERWSLRNDDGTERDTYIIYDSCVKGFHQFLKKKLIFLAKILAILHVNFFANPFGEKNYERALL